MDFSTLEEALKRFNVTLPDFLRHCRQDAAYILGWIKQSPNAFALVNSNPPVALQNGKFCIPPSLHSLFFFRVHNARAHVPDGVATANIIRNEFGFHLSDSQGRKWINNCNGCEKAKLQNSKKVNHPSTSIEIELKPLEKVWLCVAK